MIKKVFFILLFFIGALGAIILFADKEPAGKELGNGKLRVVATFYPLADFARNIGGDLVEVSTIVPAGIEPHDYEPTPKDILALRNADLILIHGAIDDWAQKATTNIPENKIVTTIGLIASIEGVVDPHIWLDPLLAIEQVRFVIDGLISIDPAHGRAYNANGEEFMQKLRRLDSDYRQSLSQCKLQTVITSHDAFGYLSARYGFKTIAINGISAEEEPSSQKISEIIDLARKENIQHVFFESLVSPKISETIAKEIGGEILLFNPLEGLTGEEISRGENYISIMNQNLENLKTAMQCK